MNGVAPVVALVAVVASMGCMSREDRAFWKNFHAIPIGLTEAEVIQRLGRPNDAGTKFYLGQPDGYEKQYREAAQSMSVRFVFWHIDIDVVCAIGLDEHDRVAYKACGGT
jgi:hypothetical protein